jgi:hypothetical protein
VDAKKAAEKQDQGDNYAYIMSIYKKMMGENMGMEKYKSIFSEYVVQEISYLKDYLNMSDDEKALDILRSASFVLDNFPNFAQENDFASIQDEDILRLIEDMEWYDLYEELYNRYRSELIEFGVDVIKDRQSYGLDGTDLPSWFYFDGAKIFKNQWLLHFTNEAKSIAEEGFDNLVDDITYLGLTTHIGNIGGRSKYGYGFSFNAEGSSRYWNKKYGYECVLFRASGLVAYHHGDEEYQYIFKGDTVKEIIPITSSENEQYAIYSKRDIEVIYESSDLEKVVNWVISNIDQYRKSIAYYKGK